MRFCTMVLIMYLLIMNVMQFTIIVIQDDSMTKFSMANATLLNCYIQQRKNVNGNI